MSYKYRILRKPFQQAPPSPAQREEVKKDLCGNTDGFVMLQTSMRYAGQPPVDRKYTLQEEEKLLNPCTCHNYILDHYTNSSNFEPLYYELVITYDTRDGPREEIFKLKPDQADQTGLFVPTLLLTFYPYDVKNPNDTSYYSYTFTTTNLQWAVEGKISNSTFITEEKSPDASSGRWIVYTSAQNDQMTPYELCLGRYFTFHKHYSDYSFHIRTVIDPSGQPSDPIFLYSQVIHLIPVYYDSIYGSPLPIINEVRERTLPPPYS